MKVYRPTRWENVMIRRMRAAKVGRESLDAHEDVSGGGRGAAGAWGFVAIIGACDGAEVSSPVVRDFRAAAAFLLSD